MLVECVSPFPQYRDNDRNGYERPAAKFEWIACPVAPKSIRKETEDSTILNLIIGDCHIS